MKHNLLKLAVVGAIAALAITANADPTDNLTNGLVSYYPFNGNAYDESGSGRDGTVLGATLTADRFGAPNSAYSFDGSLNSYIFATDANLPSGNSPRTASAWISIASFGIPSPGNQPIFCYGSGGANDTFYGVILGIQGDHPIAVGRSGGGDSPQWPWPALNTWYHVVMSHDGSTTTLYINGANVGSTSRTYNTLLNGTFYIGQYVFNQGTHLGLIDDLRLYNRALTPVEVAQLYATEADPPVITQQPQGQTIAPGASATFTVAVTANHPLTYQWRKDGLNIPGATNASHTILNAQPRHIGFYSVVVGNGAASVVSSNAALNLTGVNFGEWAGLVAWYPFNGNANDESGFGNDGVVSGAQLASDRFGTLGRAYSFDGQDDFIRATVAHLPTASESRTLAVWAKAIPNPAAGATLAQWGNPANREAFGILENSSPLTWWAQSWGGGNDANSGVVVDDRWHHLVAAYDGRLRIFVDGVLRGDLSIGISTGISPLHIGGSVEGSAFFNGIINDIRIYNRAISPGDVRQLYTLEASPCIPHPATAVATVVNGSVTDIQLTDLGCGYTNAPIVRISGGGGTGATATTTIVNGYVTSITITSAGTGYTNAPRVRIASPPFMPSLSIAVSRVKVTQRVVLGRNYVLESSSDLQSWSLVGTRFTAEDELIEQEFEVGLTGGFFRIREVP